MKRRARTASCRAPRRRSGGPVAASLACAVLLLAAGAPAVAQFEEELTYRTPFDQGGEEDPAAEDAPPEEEAPTLDSLAQGLDRITFQIPFPAEKGGGTALGSAGAVEYVREDYVVATSGVEFRYQDMKFLADRVAVDLKNQTLTAEGDVIVDQGPRRMTGDTLVFDLEKKTGEMTNAKAFVDPDIYFEGEQIAKIDEDVYTVKRGLVTSCAADKPDWSFRLTSGRVRVEGFAHMRNTTFRARWLPLMYFPYIVHPAKTERTSGFLFPNFGYSQLRGASLGLAYFQTFGPSYDTTLFLDIYDSDFLGYGNEIRYRPSQYTQGLFTGYAIDTSGDEDLRWKLDWYHASDKLPLGLRGVIRYSDFSDFNFLRDFERDFSRAAQRSRSSAAYLAGSWGQHSFTLLGSEIDTLIGDSSVTLRQLPEAEYQMRRTQIGDLPLFVDLLGSANHFTVDRGEALDFDYQRADVLPQLTASLSTLPWLSATLTAGERVTWYSDSLNRDPEIPLSGESLTRTFSIGAAKVVGPSVSRVFEKKIGRFAKFKHIIEPRFDYLFVDDFDEQDLVLQFDEVDRLRGANFFTYALVNRLLAKPEDEALEGGAREIMSFEIAQSFSLDDKVFLQQAGDERTTRGPMRVRFRFAPGLNANIQADALYDTLFSQLSSASLTGGLRLGRHGVGVTWNTRFASQTGDTITHQARFYTGFELWRDRLRFDSQVNYDFLIGELLSQRHVLQYSTQCWGLRLEGGELRRSDGMNDLTFRFALTLKNVGTFLDLTGGTRQGFQPGFR